MVSNEDWILDLPQTLNRFINYFNEVDKMKTSEAVRDFDVMIERHGLKGLSSRDFDLLMNLCKRQHCQYCQTPTR